MILHCMEKEAWEIEKHKYGVINNSAVERVLPFLKDEAGRYIKNAEFASASEE